VGGAGRDLNGGVNAGVDGRGNVGVGADVRANPGDASVRTGVGTDPRDGADSRLDRGDVRNDNRDIRNDSRLDNRQGSDNRGGDNQWRYKFHNGTWWYWLPENRWVYWNNGSWANYDAATYAAQPTYNTQPSYNSYNYDNGGYNGPYTSGYGGYPYYGRGYYGGGYYPGYGYGGVGIGIDVGGGRGGDRGGRGRR